jgi:NhaP-type Na+/H+ and K+/H+ antiporter
LTFCAKGLHAIGLGDELHVGLKAPLLTSAPLTSRWSHKHVIFMATYVVVLFPAVVQASVVDATARRLFVAPPSQAPPGTPQITRLDGSLAS